MTRSKRGLPKGGGETRNLPDGKMGYLLVQSERRESSAV